MGAGHVVGLHLAGPVFPQTGFGWDGDCDWAMPWYRSTGLKNKVLEYRCL